MKTIFILTDTLCRRYLSLYGNDWTITPNIVRLAKRSTVFDQHWCGSAPCIPARHDLLTGRLNFLERNWGGAEPYDEILPTILRQRKGTYSHLATDHMFYAEKGGENYLAAFNSWELVRGQEHDPLISTVKDVPIPAHHGVMPQQYVKNRTVFKSEEDFPTPKTFGKAVDWLKQNRGADNYFLWVEGFDPHEPFDQSDNYRELYPDDYTGPEYIWPAYAPCSDTPEQLAHVKKRYAATISMMDAWLGKLLDELDAQNAWDDSLVIFTTDHGYMFGEHGFMAKNYMPAYNEVFHIPLLIHTPGQAVSSRCAALTQNIDLFPTILDYFGVDPETCRNRLHGKSLRPVLDGRQSKVREALIYGYYGLSVNVTDGKYSYFRAARNEDNRPLNLYTASPSTLRQNFGVDSVADFTRIDQGRHLSWTSYPVFKYPADCIRYDNQSQNFAVRNAYNRESLLFDIGADYAQAQPVQDPALEKAYSDLLSRLMKEHDSPTEQFERLGLD